MGVVSFKVSNKGTRFRPRPAAAVAVSQAEEGRFPAAESSAPSGSKREINTAEKLNDVNEVSVSSTCSGGLILPEHEVSFTVNLFPRGYFIGKPSEDLSPLLQDAKSLHPYDRASETLFSAIESGWLPGDILDDIPSKYFHGTLICEVRDYRKCIPEQRDGGCVSDGLPVVNKVRLRMSLENVVKDIPSISDDSWTYSDLMEVESRILKALRPQLCLDPTPMLDRLCHCPASTKLNLGIGRKKRLRQTPEVIVASNCQSNAKKVCVDSLPENASYKTGVSGNLPSDAAMQHAHENVAVQHISTGLTSSRPNSFPQGTARSALPLSSQSKLPPIVGYTGVMHGVGSPASFISANTNISSSQNLMSSYSDGVFQPGKRESQDQSIPIAGIKRTKQTPMGLDSIQQQQTGPQFGLSGTDMHWKNQLLHPQLEVKGMQYSMMAGQRYPSQVINNMPNQESGTSFYFNHQQGMRYGATAEQIDAKLDEKSKDALQALSAENNSLDQQQSRLQQLSQQRNHLPPPTQWHNSWVSVDRDIRKDDMLQKRKSINSPRVSSGPMVQSPVSSKSGEFSSGSVGGQFNAVATTSALGSQKDKATSNSNAAVGAPSVASSPSESVQRQNQASVTVKRKANSIPKTQAMSGVGSPASVSNMSAPLNASSPSIGTMPVGDQVILQRFSKIDIITQRYQLNVKKAKIDDYRTRKPTGSSSQQVVFCLNNSMSGDDYVDPMKPLSKSIIGGTINTFKTRVLNFTHAEHVYQVVPTRSQNRLIIHEKPGDGTVAMQYGDTDDSDCVNTHDCLLTLPTSHYADLLAAQFCSLMERDKCQKVEDQTRATQIRMSAPTPSAVMGMSSDSVAAETKHPEVASGQPSNVLAITNSNSMGPMSSSQNLPNGTRLLASGNSSQALAMSQGFMPGTGMPTRMQQLEQPLVQQQQQQQQQQLQLQQNQQSQMQQPQLMGQRSHSVLSTNALSQFMGQSSNLQMGANTMVNKQPISMQYQMLQQQVQQQQQQQQRQQQQQQTQLPRKVMNLGATMGVGGNNIMGLGSLGNVMSMGGVRGMSSPMGPMSGLGSIGSSQMNLGAISNFGAGLRPGSMSMSGAQVAAFAKMRMAQNRVGMYGQPGIAGMSGNSNQMLPSSVGLSAALGHPLNRANMSPLQRNAMASMGPPKITGANFYLNPQQQLQLQQQQQQLQQQQLQQQQISSPLQQAQVGSPPVVGSPQAMVMQQQQISPQQMGGAADGDEPPAVEHRSAATD